MEVIPDPKPHKSSIFFKALSLLALLTFLSLPVYGAIEPDDSDSESPRYWSTIATYNWIFPTTAKLKDIVISINGKSITNSSIKLKKYQDVVHADIPLESAASNYIVGKISGKKIFAVDLFYAKSYHSEVVPEEYEPYLFHSNANEAPCVSCHRLTPNKTDLNPVSPSNSICYSCHKNDFPTNIQKKQPLDKSQKLPMPDITQFSDLNFIDKESQHDLALISWQCLDCHQSEPLESEFIPDTFLKFTIQEGAQIAPLCYSCHPERQKKNESFNYVHGPIGMGGCNMCHNPHYSNFAKLLEDKPTTLCIECHELEELLTKPYVHAPLKKEGCIACHAPHGSNYMYQLLADTKTLCYGCHKDIAKQKNNHPITGHPVSGSKDPRDQDLPFTCVSCHDPHSSDYEYLLSEEDPMLVCVQCHKMGG